MSERKIYLAYGSNLNLKQMAQRCPTAKVLGTSTLKDYQLMFRGAFGNAHATVEPCNGSEVPVLLWGITEEDEKKKKNDLLYKLWMKSTLTDTRVSLDTTLKKQ